MRNTNPDCGLGFDLYMVEVLLANADLAQVLDIVVLG